MRNQPALLSICAFFICSTMLPSFLLAAQEPNKAEIALSVTTEDSQKIILATVTAGGKPLANATVNFFVKRTFGNLGIGHDVTLDDGTAAVPFPTDLPGGPTGQIQVTATITNPPQYGSSRGEAAFGGAQAVHIEAEVFPRALWAPHAPLPLILTIAILSAAVWGTYIYVVFQLNKIRKGGLL